MSERGLGSVAFSCFAGAGVAGIAAGCITKPASCDCVSGGSDEGGSLEGDACFRGVRNGDLNGLCKVLLASFIRRRFACGVNIFAGAVSLAFRNPSGERWWWSRVACRLD
jgi:hypothetical protein